MCGLQTHNAEILTQCLDACLKHRVLVLRSGGNVLRFLPPLTITQEEIDEGFARFTCAMKELSAHKKSRI